MQDQIAAFDYDVTPTAIPFGSGEVTLLIGVTNNTGALLECPQIAFTLPDTLTADPGAVTPSSLAPDWGFTRGQGAGQFIASPYAPTTGLRNGATIGLMLSGIKVLAQVGGPEIEVEETTAKGLGQKWLQVMTVPPGLAITEFSVDSLAPAPGQGITLKWSTTGADVVTLSYDGGNHKVSSPSGSYGPIRLEHATPFTLTATGNGPPATAKLAVTVEQVAITSISADPTTVDQGGKTTLSWTAIFADAFTIEPGEIQLPASVTSHLVTVPETDNPEVVYTVTAHGAGHTNNPAPQIINIEPVQIISFEAQPSVVPPGGSCTLSWVTKSATSCEIIPDPGFAVDRNGQGLTTVTDTTTFRLRATGNGHAEKPVQVSVGPAVTSYAITYDPAHPDTATLSWAAAGGAVTFFDEQNRAPLAVPAIGSQPMQFPAPNSGRFYGIVVDDGKGKHVKVESELVAMVVDNRAILSFQIDGADGINVPGVPVTISWRAQSGGNGVVVVLNNRDVWDNLPDSGSRTWMVTSDSWSPSMDVQGDGAQPYAEARFNDPYSDIPYQDSQRHEGQR